MLGRKSLFSICAVIAAFSFNRIYNKALPAPTIQTMYGEVSGIIQQSRAGRNFYSYFAVPYASPPVGNLRFESPVPISKWDEIRDGTAVRANCLQYDLMLKRITGEEDCLTLNIHVPETTKKPLKTMVFFHGGIFHFGSGNAYNPKYFMDEDVIIVTVNYRLGALGFLNTMDGKINGNMGLKDQVMALKFVQENIKSFGGDENRVCIFGESAGAVSTHLHLLSPMSQGLFHCAISQSGNAVAHWALTEEPRNQALRFAEQLNCSSTDSKSMVECLKKVDPLELVDVHKEVLRPLREWITLYAPTIESSLSPDPFLPKHPKDTIQTNIQNVPYMIGVNSHEGLLVSAGIFRNQTMVQRLTSEFDIVAAKLLNLEKVEDSKKIKLLQNYYTEPQKVVDDPFLKFENYTNLFSDRMFFVPAHQSAKLHAQNNPQVYLYFYSYPRDQSLANIIMAIKGQLPAALEVAYAFCSNWIKINVFGMELPNFGSCHADELALLYPMPWSSDITTSHKDYEMSANMIKLWTSFGNKDETVKFRDTNWEPVKPNSTKLKYFNIIGLNSKMIEEPFHDRVKLWNSFSS